MSMVIEDAATPRVTLAMLIRLKFACISSRAVSKDLPRLNKISPRYEVTGVTCLSVDETHSRVRLAILVGALSCLLPACHSSKYAGTSTRNLRGDEQVTLTNNSPSRLARYSANRRGP